MVARADAVTPQPPAPARRRFALLFIGLALLAALPFAIKPDIDLILARWIWHVQGDRFLEPTGWFSPLYFGLRPLVYATAAATALIGVYSWLRGRRHFGLDGRAAAFVLLSLALGPGIVTDIALKDYWGRARPRDLVEFGGTRQFTPAFEPAKQCDRNCSFVSGHAALAFAFMPFALLAPVRRRGRAAALVIAAGAFVGMMRMLQGAHFLSDVIFAGFIVVGIALVLAAVILPGDRRR